MRQQGLLRRTIDYFANHMFSSVLLGGLSNSASLSEARQRAHSLSNFDAEWRKKEVEETLYFCLLAGSSGGERITWGLSE